MDGKPAAVLEIRRIVKRIKKLRVHHCRKEVERSVRGRYYNKKGGLSIAQCIKVYVVRVRKVCDFRKIERRKPHSRRNQYRLCGFSGSFLEIRIERNRHAVRIFGSKLVHHIVKRGAVVFVLLGDFR